jgi:hypothetical protein
MDDFKRLGIEAGTDKITSHGYHRFFPQFIERFRSRKGGMLEIGIQECNSLNLWLQYFPNFMIYGIDINVEVKGDRYEVFKCDQSQFDQLELVCTSLQNREPIYFINDDGSHIPEHQVLTFNLFFNKLLQPGGVYIIEDIETSYWVREYIYSYQTRYGYHHPKSCIELFKYLADDVNSYYMNELNKKEQELILAPYFSKETRSMIQSITFVQNCIIIQKKTEEDFEYTRKSYAFLNRI